MRSTLFMMGLAATAVFADPVSAQTPPDSLVWMVLRDINEVDFDRDDPMNRPPLVTRPPEGMIQAVDVSGDGRSDWLVDYEVAGLTPYCGTGGCVKRLYVSTGGAFVRAFDNQAFTLVVLPERRIEVWVHHLYCTDDAPDCRYRFEWDADSARMKPVWSSSTRPMGERGYPAIEPEPDGV